MFFQNGKSALKIVDIAVIKGDEYRLFGESSFAPEEKEEEILPPPEKTAPEARESASSADLPVSGRSISRIIVFYDDNTYQELK